MNMSPVTIHVVAVDPTFTPSLILDINDSGVSGSPNGVYLWRCILHLAGVYIMEGGGTLMSQRGSTASIEEGVRRMNNTTNGLISKKSSF